MKALLYFAVGLCTLFGASTVHAAEMATCSSPSEKVLLQVATVTLEEDKGRKIQDIEGLITLVAALKPAEFESVDQRAIMLLARLLADPDTGVRMWVAVALRGFGYRAEPALPALEETYKYTVDKPISEDNYLLPSTSAHYEIGNAIDVIRQDAAEHAKHASIKRGGGN